jgi:hypothetical protein
MKRKGMIIRATEICADFSMTLDMEITFRLSDVCVITG